MSEFIASLQKTCRALQSAVAFPEISDPRVADAARTLLNEGSIAKLYVPEESRSSMSNDPRVNSFEEAGVQFEEDDNVLFKAGRLIAAGTAQCAVAGATHPTADVVRAALKTVGLASGVRTVSGGFVLARGNALWFFADCGVVIDPSADQLLDIATSSYETWVKLISNQEPVFAFLSFSTNGSAVHPNSEKMSLAAHRFKSRFPNLLADGEIQIDAALDKTLGSRKFPGSLIPGKANCFIFPNLDAANIAYKLAQRIGGFDAYGPILQGLAKPFSDLSRGASTQDIIVSTYIDIVRGNT